MSLRFAIVLGALVAVGADANAQYPIDWATTFSTPSPTGGSPDRVMSSASASNGDVFLAVFSGASGAGTSNELRVLCYSSAGVLLSSTSISAATGTTPMIDYGWPVVAVDSNGFAYTSWTHGYAAAYEAELTKTDSAGNVVWTRTVDAFATFNESQTDLVIDSADNCVVVTEPHVITNSAVSKFDANGQRLWSTPWMATNGRWCADLALAPGDGVVGIGWGNSSTGAPGVAVAFDSSGMQRFLTYIDFGAGATELLYHAAVDQTGNTAVVGHVYGPLGTTSGLVLIDPTGTILWQREWLPPMGGARQGVVAFGSDGTLWTAFYVFVSLQFLHGQVLHYDRSGQLRGDAVWESGGARVQLSPGSAGDMLLCSARDADVQPSEAVLIQFDAECQRAWAWRAVSNNFFSAQTMTRAPNDRVVVSGYLAPTGPLASIPDVRTVQFDFSAAPRGYCAAETNSLGCTPNVVFTGLPRAGASDGFTISATDVLNQKSALVFYGTNGATNVPFHSGTLCVQPPLSRTLLVSTGGSAGASDCSGVVALDMNAFASGALGGNPSPALSVAGTRVWAQAWSRDPGSTSGTNLSSALTYVVLP